MTLRSWDAVWLPRAARRVQRWRSALRRRADEVAGPHTTVGAAVRAQPALAGSIASVAAAAIVLAAAGGPGGPSDRGDTFTAPVPGSGLPVVGATLGPAPGQHVRAYLDRANRDLRGFDSASHGRPGYAVVDLGRYLTPAQVTAVFRGREVVRAYVRVPGAPAPLGITSVLATQVHAIPLQGTFGMLTAGMQASGRLAAATARTFALLVKQIVPHQRHELALKERYQSEAVASAYEGRKLQRPATCACVFAVVVHADAAGMKALARTRDVRVVDPALPNVALDALTVFPLAPDITGVVPRGGMFGA